MDAPTVVIALAAGAVAVKMLVDLTVRHRAAERVRLTNEARAAARAAEAAAGEPDPPGVA